MLLEEQNDPMGCAIRDYFEAGRAGRLRVLSSMFDEDEMPVATLFRTEAEMNRPERMALQACRGRVLDVGAGAGCHALALQRRGLAVTAIDISPLSVATMRRRGVVEAHCCDFFGNGIAGPFDTVLSLMNGMGVCGRLQRLPEFFARLDALLAPGGCALADSSDLRYVFEDEDGNFCPPDGDYYGEVDFRMRYGRVAGPRFDWLYIDFETLLRQAAAAGFRAERLCEGEHYDYLARLSRMSERL